MSKGERTRQMILERVAPLFNCQGYFGASLSDIMQQTGLEKGGIYNHFASKEQLALEAFDYAIARVRQVTRQALSDKKHAVERLYALISVFTAMIEDPPVAGGCPILNTAIEADDAQPALRARARHAMDEWFVTMRRILTKGIARHEIRPDVDIEAFATLFVATLEGGIMLSKLYGDPIYVRRCATYLTHYIETQLRAEQDQQTQIELSEEEIRSHQQ
ncbi:MAG: TetR/AcrR family transcriptional regulator [Ktedonobacteraceae bacterium]|nr:TetR/AcrR family transcriptional regulator [Ktedonobacteraceae bacterium]